MEPVPVPDVLRQLQSFVDPHVPSDRRLLLLLKDFMFGRCALYHPSTPLLTSVADLPGVEAEALFVAEYNHTAARYESTCRWFPREEEEKQEVEPKDCLTLQNHLNRFMALPGWTGGVSDLDQLPLPNSATVGGFLVCRNGDGWITLAIMPVDLEPAVALTHIVLALASTLVELITTTEERVMDANAAHPMIDEAEQRIQLIGCPTKQIMVKSCLNALRRQEFTLAGAMPGEQDTFYSRGNKADLVFLMAVRAYRDQAEGPIDFWAESVEMEDVPATLTHKVTERVQRFLRRRQEILPDNEFRKLKFNINGVVPPGLIHAAWLIIRHPDDGLSTKLLVQRNIDLTVGLWFLEQAILHKWLK